MHNIIMGPVKTNRFYLIEPQTDFFLQLSELNFHKKDAKCSFLIVVNFKFFASF